MGKEFVLSSINKWEKQMATVLSSLKVINAVKQVATDSAQFRREKLCKKLDEQISLAMAVSEGNTYTVKRQRNIKDKDSGLTVRRQQV